MISDFIKQIVINDPKGYYFILRNNKEFLNCCDFLENPTPSQIRWFGKLSGN